MSRIVALLITGAFVLAGAQAGAATAKSTPVRLVKPPASARSGAALTLSVRGPRTGTVLVFLTRTKAVPKHAKPAARGRLRKGRATIRLVVPATTAAGSYRLIACLKVRKHRRCGKSARIAITVPTGGGDTTGPGTDKPGGGSPGPGPGDTTGPSGPMTQPPFAVTLTPDTARKATASIGSAGGQVTATGADGTKYKLTVPANALLSTEQISLTPVSAVGGLPLSGGFKGGVVLEPDGLAFAKDATLLVDATTDLAPGLVAFGTKADGSDFGLKPLQITGGDATLAIRHFSSAGVGGASGADLDALRNRPPSAAQDAAEQAVALALADEANGTITPTQREAAVRAALRAWLDGAVAPLVTKAKTDDGFLEDAVAELVHWLAAVQTAGDSTFATDETQQQQGLKTGLEYAYGHGFDLCVVHGDPDGVGRMLFALVIAQQLGLDSGLDTDNILRCARFRLDATWSTTWTQAKLDWDAGTDGSGTDGPRDEHLALSASNVLLTLNGGAVQGSGTGAVTNWSHTYSQSYNSCTYNENDSGTPTPSGTFVATADLDINIHHTVITGSGDIPVSAAFSSGTPTVSYTRTFCGGTPDQVITQTVDELLTQRAVSSRSRSFSNGQQTDAWLSTDPYTVGYFSQMYSVAQSRGRTDTFKLTHTPCPAATPLASCP